MGYETLDVAAVTAVQDLLMANESDVARPEPALSDADYKKVDAHLRASGLCSDMSPLLHALMPPPAYEPVSADMAMGTKHKQACGGQCTACSRPNIKKACRLPMLDKVRVL
jgi:hypothetical protein